MYARTDFILILKSFEKSPSKSLANLNRQKVVAPDLY